MTKEGWKRASKIGKHARKRRKPDLRLIFFKNLSTNRGKINGST